MTTVGRRGHTRVRLINWNFIHVFPQIVSYDRGTLALVTHSESRTLTD